MPLQNITNRPIASPDQGRRSSIGSKKKTPKTRKPLQPLPFGSGSSVASVRPPASPTLFSPSEALFSPPTPGQPRHTGITPALAQLSLDSPRGPLFKIESNTSTDLFQFEFKMPKVPKVMRAAGIAAASLLVLAATYLLVAPSPSLPPAPPPIHRIAPPKAFGRVSLEARLAATSEALAHLAEPPTAPMPLPPTLNAIPMRDHMGEDVRSVLLQSHTSPFVFHGPAAPAVPMRLHQGEDVRSILLQAAAEASAKAHIAIAKKTVVVEKEEVVVPAVEEAIEEAVAEEQPVIFDFAADAAADSWRAARLASRIEIHRSAVFMESAVNGWPVYLGPPRIAQMPSCPAKCHLMPPPWANSTYLLERAEADLVHEEAITHAYHTPTAMSTATAASSMPMTIAQPLQSLYSLLPPASTTTTFTTTSTFIIIEQPILAANPSSLLLVLRDLGSRLPSPPSMSLVQRPSGRSLAIALNWMDRTTYCAFPALNTPTSRALVAPKPSTDGYVNASPTIHTTIQRDEPQPSPHEQASLASSTAVMVVHTPESVHYNQWRARTAAAAGGAARKRPPVNPPPAYLLLCAAAATILTTLAIFLNLNPSFFNNTPSSSDDSSAEKPAPQATFIIEKMASFFERDPSPTSPAPTANPFVIGETKLELSPEVNAIVDSARAEARAELEAAVDEGFMGLHPLVLFDLQPKGMQSIADRVKTPPMRRSKRLVHNVKA